VVFLRPARDATFSDAASEQVVGCATIIEIKSGTRASVAS